MAAACAQDAAKQLNMAKAELDKHGERLAQAEQGITQIMGELERLSAKRTHMRCASPTRPHASVSIVPGLHTSCSLSSTSSEAADPQRLMVVSSSRAAMASTQCAPSARRRRFARSAFEIS